MTSIDITDIACLQPKYFFGLNTKIKGNVHYITEDEVLYPNGTVLVLHNFTGKRQKYIKLNDRACNVTNICISPNRRLIAVAEKGEPATISLYDSMTLKRRRVLSTPADKAITAKTIECMSFTFDSKRLLAVYGEPDWMLICFKPDRGKVESITRANNVSNTGTVRQIACNPNDIGVVVLVGDVLFRMLAVTENAWRQYGYSKAEGFPLRCATWLTQDRVVAGTADGKLMVVENGELRTVIKVDECTHINFQQRDEMSQSSMTALLATMGTNLENYNEINLIQAFPKGFVLDYGPGKVILFEKETGLKYKKRNVFRLDEQKPDSMIIEDASTEVIEEEDLTKIKSFSISPTQDYLVVTCGLPQLFFVYMWGPDITRQAEIKFNELGPSVHRGAITGISVCAWKPILMTVSQEDRSVRIWNYETQDLLVSRSYQDDLYGISLHATGLYALVGFSSKLRFMTLLIDDLAIIKEFPLRYCNVVRFANQGHLFAAVNGNLIQVYSSVTFDNIKNLKGHNAMITDICWITNDNVLISCGTEGALYEWDLQTGKRVQELIIKTCSFTGAAIASDGKVSYCVGSEGDVKEVINGASRMVNKINKQGLDCLVLSKIDTMLFVAGSQGIIYSMKIPLTEKDVDRLEFMVNNEKIIQMVMSYDDKYLISCAKDGMCIWKLSNVLNKAIKIDKDFTPFVDILIPYEDLEQKMQMIKDLNLRLTELDREHSYQIRQIVQSHTDKLTEVHEAYKEAIENLKEKNSTLETEHTQEIHNINMEISKTKRNHDVAIDHLEATYNEKLIVEYNKFSNLEDKLLKIRRDYDTQIIDLNSDAKANETKIIEQFIQKLKEKDLMLEELQEEIHQQLQSHETIKQQIEDDADREIYELKTAHETAILEEQAINIKLRAENGMYRKNLTASQKESEEWKTVIFNLENDHLKFRNMISGLEKDISELRKEISDRDETIQEKEKRIYDLKKRAQELEKYKYVLDFKITELKAEIEPRERRIHDQKDQIDEMVKELEKLQKNIISLELLINDLKEKLDASQSDYKREQSKLRQACEVIKSMRTDLHQASGMIHETGRLKVAVREMFHKYNADKDFVLTREEDCESKNEFLKQRHYLEKNISRLKKTVSKRFNKDQDKITMMEESNELITEVNILRHQLKSEQNRNTQMESILGFKHKNMQPREAQKLLSDAVKTTNDIRREYADEIEAQNTRINVLKDENVRLTRKIL